MIYFSVPFSVIRYFFSTIQYLKIYFLKKKKKRGEVAHYFALKRRHFEYRTAAEEKVQRTKAASVLTRMLFKKLGKQERLSRSLN